MTEKKQPPDPAPTPPPGEGESLDDTAREAVREMEKRDGGSGSGDIG
jgi:hypothetical protein